MRLALTTWNGRISPVFDVARQVAVVDVEGGRVTGRHEALLPGTDPQAQAARLAALGPQVLICGAISRPMAALLAGTGVRIIPFTAGTVNDVLAAWLTGSLPNPALSMPGCGGGRGGHGRGRCGRRGRGAGGGRGWGHRGPAAPEVGR